MEETDLLEKCQRFDLTWNRIGLAGIKSKLSE